MTLLSIIIPTHNRAKYAIRAIESILAISEEIQVVVCDSSPVDAITEHLSGDYTESRLKMIRAEQGISVVDNFNLGLRCADGEYLVFIGDDDFVSAEIIDVVKWAKTNKVESLKFNFPALYYWDDFKHSSRGDSYSGTLHVSSFNGTVKKHNVEGAISCALNNLGGGVFDMPRAYAGMVSSSLASRIVEKYGSLFGGVSPDIYSSLLISVETENCMLIDYPLIVPGASGLSTSGQSSSGGHYGQLRDNAHIAPFKNLVWDSRVPEFYSVPTVWSYSLLKAVEAVKDANGANRVDLNPNFGRLLLKCLVYFPYSYRETWSSFRSSCAELGSVTIILQILKSIGDEFLWVCSRIVNRVRAKYENKEIEIITNLNTSLVASVALNSYLKKRGVRLVLP